LTATTKNNVRSSSYETNRPNYYLKTENEKP
jgi:hypothetical protein